MRPGSKNTRLKWLISRSTLLDEKKMVFPALIIAGGLLLWASIGQASRTLHALVQVLVSGRLLSAAHGLSTFLLLLLLLAQALIWPILWGYYALIAFRLLRWKPPLREKPVQMPQRFESWHRERPLVETDKLQSLQLELVKKEKQAVPVMASVLAPDAPSREEETGAMQKIITGKSLSLPSVHPSRSSIAPAKSLLSSSPLQSGFSGTLAPLDLAPQSQLHLRVETCTSAGFARAEDTLPNTDSLVALQGTRAFSSQVLPFGLFIVADGKSLEKNGREAGRLAVQTVQQTILPLLLGSSIIDDAVLIERMSNGVRQANRVLYQHNLQNATGMRATLVAGLILGTKAFIVNVGDNRAYHYRKDKGLTQITRDHSVVARLLGAKMITAEEVYTHPDRHLIYRNVGEFARVDEIDSFIVLLEAGDSLLFCSDGLWKRVRDTEIKNTFESDSTRLSQVSSLLVQSALKSKEEDSASAIVINIC